jgi:hypothetical protein
MASREYTLQGPGDWLAWVDSNLGEKGANSRVSNFDKLKSKYLIKGNPTWGELYEIAAKQYRDLGGTQDEIRKNAPNQGRKEEAKERKVEAEATQRAVDADPFGTNHVNRFQLQIDTDENGMQTLKGIQPNNPDAPVQMFLYTVEEIDPQVSPSSQVGTPVFNKDSQLKPNVYQDTNYSAIRAKILQDVQKVPGGLNDLFTKLKNTGSITQETFDSKNISAPDFAKALRFLVEQYSIEMVNNYSVLGEKNVKTFNNWLAEDMKEAGKTSKTTYDMVVTTRQDAADEANQFFMQYLGRAATKVERDNYFRELNAAEKKAVRSTTTTAEGNRTTTGDLLSETDRTLIMGKVAGNAIKGTDIDALMKAGGVAAQDVDTILSIGRNYGVKVSREQATKYVADNLRQGKNLNSTKAKIIEISRSNYKNFSDKISEDVSVKELAGNYIYNKAQTLELNPDAIDIFDADIQDAINGNVTMTDFNVRLRQNPAWAKTKNAKDEAAEYANTILKSFGLMA